MGRWGGRSEPFRATTTRKYSGMSQDEAQTALDAEMQDGDPRHQGEQMNWNGSGWDCNGSAHDRYHGGCDATVRKV